MNTGCSGRQRKVLDAQLMHATLQFEKPEDEESCIRRPACTKQRENTHTMFGVDTRVAAAPFDSPPIEPRLPMTTDETRPQAPPPPPADGMDRVPLLPDALLERCTALAGEEPPGPPPPLVTLSLPACAVAAVAVATAAELTTLDCARGAPCLVELSTAFHMATVASWETKYRTEQASRGGCQKS